MARMIEWDGQPLALLVEGPDGDYLVPPVVFDDEENLIQGAEILEAIVSSGVTVALPVRRNTSPGDLALIDQQVARISNELGVPIGPPVSD